VPLLLTRRDVESVLTMKDTIEAVEDAFRELGQGTADMPLRSVIRPGKHGGSINYMPAYLGGMDALAIKVVSVYADNPKKHNLPTILGTILVHDPRTGALEAIMDGGWVTAMRTGAVGGVAAKYLAREDARKVGIFGTGVQAKTQLMAVNEVREIEEVKACDIVPESARKFCEEMTRQLGIPVVQHDPDNVVTGSDIVITATTSKVPVFRGSLLRDGTHVNGIGSHHGPGIKELDEETIRRAKVVVDQREACLKEAGDIIDPISAGIISADHVYAELGELVTGKKKGRTQESEITVFKSVGLAVQDAATAARVFALARKSGIGKTIEI
jgi:alanine dehydrogenase